MVRENSKKNLLKNKGKIEVEHKNEKMGSEGVGNGF